MNQKTTVAIYDDIPVPPRKHRSGSKCPFGELEVGQSIFFSLKEGEETSKAISRLAGSASRYRRSQEIDTVKYVVRAAKHPETGADVVGVWRTA